MPSKAAPTRDLVLESTTLWDFPTQNYGDRPHGDNKYRGVTPAFVIWNVLQRYTKEGDLVVDPMAGSGTTIDVAREMGRQVVAYDIAPTREDVLQNDARCLPLGDSVATCVFVDSPYGDNIQYNDHPNCIGKISANSPRFFEELEKCIAECHRVLKPHGVLAWMISDQWNKRKFVPVGLLLYQRLTRYFEPIDLVCIARRNQTSHTGIWHYRARRNNFFLRGFKYLFLMRKTSTDSAVVAESRAQYKTVRRKRIHKRRLKKL